MIYLNLFSFKIKKPPNIPAMYNKDVESHPEEARDGRTR